MNFKVRLAIGWGHKPSVLGKEIFRAVKIARRNHLVYAGAKVALHVLPRFRA
jgi:hypothetical protein